MGRSMHPRSSKITIGVAAIAVATAALAAGSAAAVSPWHAGHIAVAMSAHVAPCKPSAVMETVSTNQRTYGPGTVVWMTALIRNKSVRTCSVWVGPFSPSFTVTNSTGAAVWNKLWAPTTSSVEVTPPTRTRG